MGFDVGVKYGFLACDAVSEYLRNRLLFSQRIYLATEFEHMALFCIFDLLGSEGRTTIIRIIHRTFIQQLNTLDLTDRLRASEMPIGGVI